MNEKVKNVLKGISHTGYTTEIERTEARLLIEDLYKENQQLKEVIDKADKWVRDFMDEWDINDEVRYDLNDLLILLEEVE